MQRFSSSDQLAIALACIAAIMAIILFLVEKVRWSIIGSLLAIVVLSIHPTLHFFRKRRYQAVVITLVSVVTLAFGYYLWPVEASARRDGKPPFSDTAIKEITELNLIFAGKDELQLRSYYGFQDMLAFNLSLNKERRIRFRYTGDQNFDIRRYAQVAGREIQFDAQYSPDALRKTESGFLVIPDIDTVQFLILSIDFSQRKKELLKYKNSAVLPARVRERVSDFDRALQDNADIMKRVENIALRQNPEYFIANDEFGTPYYKVIDSRYWNQFVQLRPVADKITEAIRESLETN